MKNFVYYLFSPDQYRLDEIIYSLHSAYRFLPPARSDYRFVIYSHPECDFNGLRSEVVRYDPQQLQDWAGPHNFRWRIKVKTLQDALQRYGESTVLIDGDTYFRKSPERLFDRIRPGHAILHMREGRVCDLEDKAHQDLSRVLSNATIGDRTTGNPIRATNAMWNAGVVGLHPSDAHLMENIVDLTDRIIAEEPIITAEQFAFSYCLATQTKLRPCDDVVYHYWNMLYRRPFRQRMTDALLSTKGMPEAERAEQLYAIRPQTPLPRRIRNLMVKVFDNVGIRFEPGCTRQNG